MLNIKPTLIFVKFITGLNNLVTIPLESYVPQSNGVSHNLYQNVTNNAARRECSINDIFCVPNNNGSVHFYHNQVNFLYLYEFL